MEEQMINWDFIAKLEGESQLIGYVPFDRDKDNSGVTIGLGIDLGHRSETELRTKLYLPDPMVDKFKPYIGKIGKEARLFLKKNPLMISEAEEKVLNTAVKRYFENKLRKRYNKESKYNTWDNLGDTHQTVIMSVYHQYGNQMFRFEFWKQALMGDWAGMLHNLRDFGDAYDRRRNIEANLLETYLLY